MTDINSRLSTRQVLPVFSIYVLLCMLGLYHHELWLDESQHFLIGRDSDSLSSLYYNMRYDGHPRLWNFLIYFITHYITRSYAGMQVLHLLIVSATAFIFLRNAPFSLLEKILILSGYYFIFEYSVISRNYAPGILLLFTACSLLVEPRKNLLWIGVVLFLMCNTHLFLAFSAIGIFFYLLVEFGGKKEWLTSRFLLLTFLFLAGFVLAVIQTRTPPEENMHLVYPKEWLSKNNLSFAAFGLIRGWLPIPQFRGPHFWNTSSLNQEHIGGVFEIILFLFLLIVPGIVLKRNIKAVLFYYTSLFFLLSFFVVTQQTAARYFGMSFIYFLAAAWLSADGSGDAFSVANLPGNRRVKLFLRYWVFGVLILQSIIGIFVFEQGLTRPFSQSRNAVRYIQSLQPSGEKIVVDGYITGPMLCAYLGGNVFYLATGQEGSYVIWRSSYFSPKLSISQAIARNPALRGFGEFILVSNRKEDPADIHSANGNYRLSPLQSFENGIVNENFYIYRVDPI
ncbi:MAG TPA: hypothetical protein VG101_09820 [Puia sp.]|jgi:hypothetical protein|nr:hypothetical protein [Puia sp.]